MSRNINLGHDIAPDQETEACGVDMTQLSVLKYSVLMENLRNSKANRSEGHCRLKDGILQFLRRSVTQTQANGVGVSVGVGSTF